MVLFVLCSWNYQMLLSQWIAIYWLLSDYVWYSKRCNFLPGKTSMKRQQWVRVNSKIRTWEREIYMLMEFLLYGIRTLIALYFLITFVPKCINITCSRQAFQKQYVLNGQSYTKKTVIEIMIQQYLKSRAKPLLEVITSIVETTEMENFLQRQNVLTHEYK